MFFITVHRRSMWLTLAVIFVLLVVSVIVGGCAATADEEETELRTELDQEQLEKLNLLDRTADEMLKLMKEGNISDARDKLLAMSDQATRIRYEGVTTIEGLNALTELLTGAQKTLNSVRLSHEQAMEATMKLRLATDAMTHRLQPMWEQYFQSMSNQLDAIEQAAARLQREQAISELNRLYHQYSMVRPSIMISREPQNVVKLDSLFTFLNRYIQGENLKSEEMRSAIGELRNTLKFVFGKVDAATYLSFSQQKQPLAWSLAIGSAILAALLYTAWRMFVGGRSIVPIDRGRR